MTDLNLYIIRNSDGLYHTGGMGGRFSKKPKVWTNRAHAVSSLTSSLQQSYNAVGDKYRLPPTDWELVEIAVSFEREAKSSCYDIIVKKNRFVGLKGKHGEAFAALVEMIESKGEDDLWKWALCAGSWRDKDAGSRIRDILKTQKLKQNVDYRLVSRSHQIAVAFKDKSRASLVRLTFNGDVSSIDLTEYVESDIDESEVTC